MPSLEICVADPGGARTAQEAGADRVELCAALEVGGLTPSPGALALTTSTVPVHVLVRPRQGDFVYDADEAATLLLDVAGLAALAEHHPGRLGVTTGALTDEGLPDLSLMARVVEAARGLPVRFHRAFDVVADPTLAAEGLASVGVTSLLTAGGPGAAHDHLDVLARLARGPVPVVAAGSIRQTDAAAVAATGVAGIHLRAPQHVAAREGTSPGFGGGHEVTDEALVVAVAAALRPARGGSA